MSPNRQKQQRIGVPPELVRDYRVDLLRDETVVTPRRMEGNHLLLSLCDLPPTEADTVRITIEATNGDPKVVVHEVRIY